MNRRAILAEGQIIRDTYEVERFLGEGAFAEVYRVKHRFLGRQAMKVFKAAGMALAEIEEVLSEAILLSKIGHSNIVRVFDANVVETSTGLYGYFTMENVPGGSLDQFSRSHNGGYVPAETTINLIKQVCRGLSVAHSEVPPVIHRDIKPQNILVGYEADGLRARISDFGLARSVNPLTLLATAAGTLCFKPPEAFRERKGDSCAADVWAIGTTLYQLLTGHLPYEVPDDLGWGHREFYPEEVRAASELNADVDDALDSILARALSITPEGRYQNAMEMLDALERWQAGVPARASEAVAGKVLKAFRGSTGSPDREEAEHVAQQAIDLKQQGRLPEAADLMEEAFNQWPALRERYAPQVRLWRCGITM